MAELATAAAVLTAGAAVVSAGSSLYAGQQAKEASQLQAKQLEAKGREEFAASQRDALEARLEGKLLQSRQQAVAAASGGGSGLDAPSIVKLMTETGERTDYAARAAIYGGQSRRDYYNASAAAARREGNASLLGSFLRAAGTLAGGFGNSADMLAN